MATEFKFNLGAKVRDRITGYTGIVTGRHEWIHMCHRYSVQSQELKDGKPIDACSFDVDALDLVQEAPEQKLTKDTGGPAPEPRRAPEPSRMRNASR